MGHNCSQRRKRNNGFFQKCNAFRQQSCQKSHSRTCPEFLNCSIWLSTSKCLAIRIGENIGNIILSLVFWVNLWKSVKLSFASWLGKGRGTQLLFPTEEPLPLMVSLFSWGGRGGFSYLFFSPGFHFSPTRREEKKKEPNSGIILWIFFILFRG